MYSNIFEHTVSVHNVAQAFSMYPDIAVPLTESLSDWFNFIEDMVGFPPMSSA